MIKSSDKIITHSESGKSFVAETFPEYVDKVQVIMHPIRELFPIHHREKTTDFLIWGSVYRYKGIVKFLKYISSDSVERPFKVKIVGKCVDKEYQEEIEGFLDENIEFCNEVLDLEEINTLAQESKFILFTYNSDTVISSGSLIDSIRMGSQIMGPNHGAFKDLSYLSFVHRYEDFSRIPDLFAAYEMDDKKTKIEREAFYNGNNWGKFIERLDFVISNN